MIGSRNMITRQATMSCQDEKRFSRSLESIGQYYFPGGAVARLSPSE